MICPVRGFSPFEAVEPHHLTGTLTVPRRAGGVVVVAQAEGTTEPSAFQQAAADLLRPLGLATCTVDLLDPIETENQKAADDVDLLTERLERVVEFLADHPQTWHLAPGILCNGMVAAAAATLASERPGLFRALVCCAGRPDLSLAGARFIVAPTLLIAPGRRAAQLRANENFFLQLRCPSQLALVRQPEDQESDARLLETSARQIRDWYRTHMRRAPRILAAETGEAKTGTGGQP